MTFEEFQATRTFCSDLSTVDGIGDLVEAGTAGFLYDGETYITIDDAPTLAFWLDIEGAKLGSNDLSKLERELHAWSQSLNGDAPESVDTLKARGDYYEAGRAAFSTGADNVYGCHFGLKKDLKSARTLFERGFSDAISESNKSA